MLSIMECMYPAGRQSTLQVASTSLLPCVTIPSSFRTVKQISTIKFLVFTRLSICFCSATVSDRSSLQHIIWNKIAIKICVDSCCGLLVNRFHTHVPSLSVSSLAVRGFSFPSNTTDVHVRFVL